MTVSLSVQRLILNRMDWKRAQYWRTLMKRFWVRWILGLCLGAVLVSVCCTRI